ncbi:MAG: cytidylate kinase family protein [Deltaproteobacteria bacterium]|nr:cytidylate kinase family protein [Deltaproteobacteria bacterium]
MAVITICRGTLSGGRLLAEKLGARLGYRTLSREVVVGAATQYGVSEEKLLNAMQSPPGLWDRFRHQAEDFILAVQAALAEQVQAGDVIYHGLAGQFLLRNLPGVIRLRLIAPAEYRLRAATTERGLSPEEAERYLETVDGQRQRWVRHMYDADWADPALYDLVINLECLSLEAAVELVADLAGRKEYAPEAARQRAIDDFVIAARARATLAFRSGLREHGLAVSVRDGVVHVDGGAAVQRNRDAIARLVGALPGVARVVCEGDPPSDAGAGAAPREKTAGEFMVPITGYPHVHESVTIREAMAALGASAVKLADGYLIRPRYVLVVDRAGEARGVVTRRDLLRGLLPELRRLERTRELVVGLVPTADFSGLTGLSWLSFFSAAAVEGARQPVQSVMAPIRGTVRAGDGLSRVVSTMIQHGIDLVPVQDGGRTVGVVLMTDVFDTVAEFVMERGGPQGAAR